MTAPTGRIDIRNIAIIAHVDHGKTTLVDAMLRQTDVFHARQKMTERIMDSGDLERERGITILAKNTAIRRGDVKINIVDTPGHADFGGEVERVLNMVEGVLLLIDAVEGPMPQTRFVLRKALELGHQAIVVVNKMDRPNARPEWAVNATFDLFVDLGATDEQANFTTVYTRALDGFSSLDPEETGTDLGPLFDTIIELPGPKIDSDSSLQLLVTNLEYDEYKGRMAIGRLRAGTLERGQDVVICKPDQEPRKSKVSELFVFENLGREAVESADAGEIVSVAGMEGIAIGETITDPANPRPLTPIAVEEPTVQMAFMVNTSPFAGREGKYVTSRVLRERLMRELERDVALRVEDAETSDAFLVSGRGELHLAILIETMRREGYEVAVGNPEVIFQDVGGERHEPYEDVYIEVAEEHMGAVVEMLGRRRGEMRNVEPAENGVVNLHFVTPTRGLLGFRNSFLTATRGTGIVHTLFHAYGPWAGDIEKREVGSIVAHEPGTTTGYALDMAQVRGVMFVGPGVEVYAGMIVGQRARPGELVVNVCKKKQVTNHRKSFAEEGIQLTPPMNFSLDEAIEYIGPDELVEVTPEGIRMRKRELNAELRQRIDKRARLAKESGG